jgi:predicted transcriptional regulator
VLRKTIALTIAAVLISLTLGLQSVSANTKADPRAELTEKARAGIQKIGIGKEARVEVKLQDKTKLKGYVSEAGETSFTVTDPITEASSVVPYSTVTQIKGHNLTTRTKIIIWVAIAAAAGIILYSIRGAFCDGQC